MDTKRFGWTGVEVAEIGMGTWMLADREESRQALTAGLDAGMRHVDCAEMYGNEELVGRALRGGRRREDVFLVSKVLPSNGSYAATIRACQESLRRLGTDHLDLYLLHWRGSVPLAETMGALEDLADRGLTRYIGVSNFDVADLEEAVGVLRKHRLACNQVLYHLRDRGIERRLIPWCVEREIAVVGYSPFGQDGVPAPGSRGGRVLAEIARAHDRTVRQVVLNFLTRNAGVFAIPKSGRVAHVRENAGGSGWRLEESDLKAIDSVFPAPDRDVPLGMA